ncbi:HD domain-containing protein [Salinarchaeum laminariae]|uniref:HD domain-containing protein n=1 Tax=Salinarchaeum laminariae TaxID=869888 RepID=UPI0020BFFAE8|nr:HD domain-containing protein [Salinarchaeum laminariae]
MPESVEALPDWDVPGATEQPYPAVAAEMQSTLAGDSSGHDLAHAWRVFSLGRSIAADEDADPHVVGLAALVHDHHRVVNGHEFVHPEATLEDVEAILTDAGVTDRETIDAVQHCVAVHDDYEYRDDPRRPDSVEAAVLQDADNLDALGAVGVGRCFAFGGDRGIPLWRPDGEEPCVLGHFDEKLYRLVDECNTETAREIAADRTEFLETFAERFRREWRGER